jgi:hypothetical protein
MILSARVRGDDRFARRLAAIVSAPRRSMVVGEAAAIVAEAVRDPARELIRRGREVDVSIAPGGPLERKVVVAGEGLWEHEFGSRGRSGTGSFAGAARRVAATVRRSLLRRSREAVERAARGAGHGN